MSQEHRPQRYRQEVADALTELVAGRPGAVPRGMFGYPGFAVGGKMFVCLFNDGVALKLPPEQVEDALSRPGVYEFRPGGKRMRGWVYIEHADPAEYAQHDDLLTVSLAYVTEIAAAAPPPTARRRRRSA